MIAEPKKIILFDSWTKGTVNIIRLLGALKNQNMEILLVHMGSWGDDVGRPDKEVISGINVHDIRIYDGFESVLQIEQPDLVLFLSLDPILHRAFNRYCIANKIPTVNLYHGVHSVYESLSAERKNIYNYWLWVASRAKRTLKYILPVYILSLIRSKASPREWISFIGELFSKMIGIGISKAPPDAVASWICVFNDYDVKHAQAKFSVSPNRIAVVGYPDITKFNGLEKLIFRYTEEASYTNDYIVYIGTGIRGTKMMLVDEQDYYQHLMDTNEEIKKINKRMVCKLHYSRINAIKQLVKQNQSDIDFCEDDEFVGVLQKSCGAIIEPSTAALVPVLMGKPVFLAQYGKLFGLTFGPALASYPKSYAIVSLSDLSLIGKPTVSAGASMDTNTWIKSVSGPFPASKMPERVVNVLNSAIRANS